MEEQLHVGKGKTKKRKAKKYDKPKADWSLQVPQEEEVIEWVKQHDYQKR